MQPLSKKTRHRHEQSLDDFMKHLKKLNIKSERHLSPKFYMYSKNHQTNHTLQRSRTLSQQRSQSKKTKVSTIKKVSKILQSKSNLDIEKWAEKIKKVQKYLSNKSKIGVNLCQKFNDVLANIVININQKVQELAQRYDKKIDKLNAINSQLQKKIRKLEVKTYDLLAKQQFNNRVIYQLRIGSQQIPRIDVDKIFGLIHGIQGLGGHGYQKQQSSEQSKRRYQQEQKSHSQQYADDSDIFQDRVQPLNIQKQMKKRLQTIINEEDSSSRQFRNFNQHSF